MHRQGQRRWLKQRQAVEPAIGHAKHDAFPVQGRLQVPPLGLGSADQRVCVNLAYVAFRIARHSLIPSVSTRPRRHFTAPR